MILPGSNYAGVNLKCDTSNAVSGMKPGSPSRKFARGSSGDPPDTEDVAIVSPAGSASLAEQTTRRPRVVARLAVAVDRFKVLGEWRCARMGARACARASMVAETLNGRRYRDSLRRALRVGPRGD